MKQTKATENCRLADLLGQCIRIFIDATGHDIASYMLNRARSGLGPDMLLSGLASEATKLGTQALATGQFELSTDAMRGSERFGYYCDLARSTYLGFDIGAQPPGEFYGRMKGIKAGSVVITHTSLSPATWTRTRRAALDQDESIVLMQMRRGSGRLSQANRDMPLTIGSFAMYVSTMPSVIELHDQTVRASIKLPRAMVETQLRPGHSIGPTQFRPDDPIMTMLVGYAQSYAREFGRASADAAQMAGRHIADLLALALGAHRDAQAQIAEGGLKAARTTAILDAIARHHASPFASPAAVGGSLGISERHVHRLLEETNRTFYEHLLEARLSAAYQVLTDRRQQRLPVAEVATRSGFINVSHFNRAFRTRFGDTPTGVRASSLL